MNEKELKGLLEALGQDTFWINPSEYKKIYYTNREGNFYLIIENKKDVDKITNLLNQQNARIKELEKENQQLKEQLSLKMEELHIAYCSIENVKTKNGELKAEIKTLKQSQKQLAIDKLEKVKECIHSYVRKRNKECTVGYYNEIPKYRFDEIIENQIKSLKGEE
nr:MAG TPA: Mnd1, Putative tbpip family protein cycle.2A [Caudoviricetes sp.]